MVGATKFTRVQEPALLWNQLHSKWPSQRLQKLRERCSPTEQDCNRGTVQKQVHRNFYGKAEVRVRSEGMRSTCLLSVSAVALVLWLLACGNARAQTTGTALSCTKDAECPSGQRCGFTSGCKSKGKCVVPSHDAHCIDPGGRCGCDGRPVDIFCAVGSRTEYTSAPTDAVGPCPRPCTRELSCGKTGLVCRNGVC